MISDAQFNRWHAEVPPGDGLVTLWVCRGPNAIPVGCVGFENGDTTSFIVRTEAPTGPSKNRYRDTLHLHGATLEEAINEAELALRQQGWHLADDGLVTPDTER